MKLLGSSVLIAAVLALSTASALAQDKPRTVPESKAPATDVTRPGTLSDKLGETGGVIHPSENVDPHMDKSAPPNRGNTPVIKPPGTDGRAGPTPK